jgi:4-hydroxyproline epimerase
MGERLERIRLEHDWVRTALVHEPRGSEAMVGGVVLEPEDADCVAGVIFFNSVGYLGMCGHGTIGLVATLAHLGRLGPGDHRIETPVGEVTATLHETGEVTIANVASYRSHEAIEVDVDGYGRVRGDVAWGGNWFFLISESSVEVSYARVDELTVYTKAVRRALKREGITGEGGEEIDHVEVFGPFEGEEADGRNFVLCPGGAYDRSPCGTGTSAKLACLVASGKLKAGELWRQASILGTVFEGRVEIDQAGRVIPRITGRAYVTGEMEVIRDSEDPFRDGIAGGTVR